MKFIRFDQILAGLVLTTVLLSVAAPSQAVGLTDLLVSKVGVSPVQAEGGAGSIFKLAKSQLTAENFGKLKSAVPAMNKYLAAAPVVPPVAEATTTAPASGTSQLASAAAKVLGNSGQLAGMSSKLATIQQLAPAFEALGMKSKLAGKFLPVVVDYVKSSGGPSVAKLLTGALGF
jgi:Protein of unknown function VcgC/VcgE (DUF2780)